MEIALIILGGLCLLYLLLVFLCAPTVRKHSALEKIKGEYIAHRGLHDDFLPENSLPAFKAAVDQNLPIEIDVHLTADGNVVVFHDATLKRMCGVDKRVTELTLDELKKYRLKESDAFIPTLQECLATVGGRVPLLIEFKMENGNTNALCMATDQILSNYAGPYLIQSFYPQVVSWYKKHRKNVCRGQLAANFKFKKEGVAKWLAGKLLLNFMGRPDFVSYKHSDHSSIMLKFVVWLGAFPIGWTFQSSKELKTNQAHFKTWIFENLTPKK